MRGKLRDSFLSGSRAAYTDEELQRQRIEHRHRSNARLRFSAEDVARMVKEFAAARGGITMGPPAYAALSPQYRV